MLQFTLMLNASFVNFDDQFFQRGQGLLDEPAFAVTLSALKEFMAQPGPRAYWRLSKHRYHEAFRNFVDDLIAAIPIAPPISLAQVWRAALQEKSAPL